MNRRTVFLMALAGASGCYRASKPRLNIFNWSSYVAEDTIPNFEREFGVNVRYAVYESMEQMLARVMTGNSGWDVVFPTHYLIGPMRDMGLLAALDRKRLPNAMHLAPEFQRPAWDPELAWSVPYMWTGTGIVHHRTAGEADSWNALWSPAWKGRMTMLDDPVDVFAACLQKLGKSMNTDSEADLRLAAREAIAQKKLLRAYLNAEVRDQLVAGDVLAAQLWSTTAQQAIDGSKDLQFVFPRERFALYVDNSAILRESKRKELAHEFVNYLLRPKVAADIAIQARTACANGEARKLLPPEIRDNPTLFPPAEVMARGEWAGTPSLAIQRLRDRLWTEIKSS
jgi:spermidine/putrescine transport system substrate-binding protein